MHTKKWKRWNGFPSNQWLLRNSLVSAATYSLFIYSCQWLKSFEFFMICSTISQSFIDFICYSEAERHILGYYTTGRKICENFIDKKKKEKKIFIFLINCLKLQWHSRLEPLCPDQQSVIMSMTILTEIMCKWYRSYVCTADREY